MKSNYIAANDNAFAAQLNLFKNKIGDYAATVGVTVLQIAAQAADANYYTYVLQGQEIMQSGAQQWTSWKSLLRGGGTPPPTGAPVVPTLPAVVPAVAPGVEVRFRALAKAIKSHANYNESIGEALGIEGAHQAAPDLSTLKPELTVGINGNRVEVGWGWQGYVAFLDLCELQVDRGAGFGLLAYDTTPGYVDTAPFPTVPAKWTYKAIYRVGDAQTGQWSNPVSLTVGG